MIEEEDQSKNIKLLRVWIDKDIVNKFKQRCYRNDRSMTEVLIEFMDLYSK